MDVKLPQLAEGVESGTVVNILVSAGQEIKKDQAFMELETQKAVGSIPSPSSGTVTKVHVKEGMEVSVGQVLISIDSGAGASASEPTNSAPKSASHRAQPKAALAPKTQTASESAPGEKSPESFHYQ
jgi:pyruvate dehydrogenase E2 component (dihydrolipoamide acetyltransferase)